MNKKELKKILKNHVKWMKNESNGIRADLSYADLSHAYLAGADLIGANLIGAITDNTVFPENYKKGDQLWQKLTG